MEESYKKRLVDEIAANEKRIKTNQDAEISKRKALEEEIEVLQEQRNAFENRIASCQRELEESREASSIVQAALDDALQEIRRLHDHLEQEQSNNASLAAALSDALRQSTSIGRRPSRDAKRNPDDTTVCSPENQYDKRLAHHLTQIEANNAMEVEISEHMVERLQKDNEILRRRLAAATAAIETISSPSKNLIMQRMITSCPTGVGKGAIGTPHDIALARARMAALEDEQHISAQKVSRFAKEIGNAAQQEGPMEQKSMDVEYLTPLEMISPSEIQVEQRAEGSPSPSKEPSNSDKNEKNETLSEVKEKTETVDPDERKSPIEEDKSRKITKSKETKKPKTPRATRRTTRQRKKEEKENVEEESQKIEEGSNSRRKLLSTRKLRSTASKVNSDASVPKILGVSSQRTNKRPCPTL